MNAHIRNCATLVLALGASLQAHAQIYAGGSVGRSNLSIDRDAVTGQLIDLGFNAAATTVKESDTAFRLFAGYQFNPYLAVEAAYVDLGDFRFRSTVDPAGTFQGTPSVTGEEVSAVGRYPFAERFAVYARVGGWFSRTRTTYTGTGSVELVSGAERQKKNASGLAYAVGGSYSLNSHLGLRAEWARYMDLGNELTGGKTDARLISVGVTYMF